MPSTKDFFPESEKAKRIYYLLIAFGLGLMAAKILS